jgi:flagellar hook-length control protein FliK
VDVRNLVMTALATAGAGPEAEAFALSSTQADLRPIMAAAPDMARPVEVWQPPASGFARNLAQQIRTATFVDGHTRISLAPRGLGEIEIDMRPDEAGKLRIILRAENPAVLHALRGDRDGLLLTLTESGADVRDADLSFEDFGQRHRREAGSADAPTARIADIGPADTPDPVDRPRHIGATGTLDMLT